MAFAAIPLLFAGFLVPGFFLAKALNVRQAAMYALVFSLVLLFQGIFFCEIFRLEILASRLAGILFLVSMGALALSLKSKKPVNTPPAASVPFGVEERLWFYAALITAGLLIFRVAVQPNLGFDTFFRWDFLARKIFEFKHFNFYPAVLAEDFKFYPYPEGIPPMVSFANWWTYGLTGQTNPHFHAVFVGLQYVSILLFSFSYSKALQGRLAGFRSLALLATASIVFWPLLIAQEIGLLTLSLIALMHAYQNEESPLVLAFCAALGILSREIGWLCLPVGLILGWQHRRSGKDLLFFLGIVFLLAGPWYLRNFWKTGNPLYDNPLFGLFPSNVFHQGVLAVLYENQKQNVLTILLPELLATAPLITLFGVFALWDARKKQFGLIASLGLWVAVGVYFLFFSQGILYGSRIFCIVVVPLSCLLACSWTKRIRGKTALLGVAIFVGIFIVRAWTQNVSFPGSPQNLKTVVEWVEENSKVRAVHVREHYVMHELLKALPEQARVFSDSHYLHAAMDKNARNIEMVAASSPEVTPLYSKGRVDSTQFLKTQGIHYALLCDQCPTTQFFEQFDFYQKDRKAWKVLGHWDAFTLFEL